MIPVFKNCQWKLTNDAKHHSPNRLNEAFAGKSRHLSAPYMNEM